MLKKDFETPGVDINALLNTTETIIDATLPWINEIIARVGHSDNINTPHGRTAHIKALEIKAQLYDKYFLQLIAKGDITE